MLGLTPRQYEVLVLLAQGHPMKTIGRKLNISVATAKAHTETLYQRLNVHNRNAAVYTAVSKGAKLGWSSLTNNVVETESRTKEAHRA
jgi:DNA-binding NarL/FixJ family response regulator